MKHFLSALILAFGLVAVQFSGVAAQDAPATPPGGDAQNASPTEGGDATPAPTEEAQAEAATPAIEEATPPDNTPVMGPCSGATVNYDDSDGTGAAQDAMLATAEGPPAECAAAGEAAQEGGGEAEAAAPAEGEGQAQPAETAAPAEGEGEAAAPAEGGGEAAGGGAAAGDPAAIEAGQALFVGQLGCYGCHGQDGGGGMGPALNDGTWIYGGDEASITESVTNGRPGGMPAFGEQASEEEISQVVAFVMSLSQ